VATTQSPRSTRPNTTERRCSECDTVAPPRKRICAECGGAIVSVSARETDAAPAPAEPAAVAPAAVEPEPDPFHIERPGCRYCGATPVADVTFRANTGMVIAWRMKSFPGPFCRDCGIAGFRSAMNHTLMLGWFGLISFFANLLFVAQNLLSIQKVRGLGTPVRPEGRKAVKPEESLFRRPGVYVAVVVLAVVGFFFIGSADSEAGFQTLDNLPGRCAQFKASDTGRKISKVVDCTTTHDAKILDVVTESPSTCPAGSTTAFKTYKKDDPSDVRFICVNEDE
jgi:hypothetical protein